MNALDNVRKAMREHWPQVICNHEQHTDHVLCACGERLPERPSVGTAIDSWVDHVFERAVPCPVNSRTEFDTTTHGNHP